MLINTVSVCRYGTVHTHIFPQAMSFFCRYVACIFPAEMSLLIFFHCQRVYSSWSSHNLQVHEIGAKKRGDLGFLCIPSFSDKRMCGELADTFRKTYRKVQ